MANKDMERLVISGLDEHNYILVPDTTLSKDGVPADAGAVGDALEDVDTEIDALKEDLSQITTEGTVPTSEQMLSDNYTEDDEPYMFRRTASGNADREELDIVGGSMVWNQLVPERYSSSTSKLTAFVAGTVITEGHKYLITRKISASVFVAVSVYTRIDGTNTKCFGITNTATGAVVIADHGGVSTGSSSATDGNVWLYQENSGNEVTVTDLQIHDITAMFGSTIADYIYGLEQATAGAGVAWFRRYFPKDFYAYSAPTMSHVSGLSEHKTVGFNAWDEQGEWVTRNGMTCIWTKNYVPVLPNTEYCFTVLSSTYPIKINQYDENKTLISTGDQSLIDHKRVITTNARTAYLLVGFNGNYGNIYKHDICINLSDPAKNGQYEPYQKHSYALDDSLTLRGIPTLVDGKIKWDGDVYAPSGTVTRKEIQKSFDGTENWSIAATGTIRVFRLTNAFGSDYIKMAGINRYFANWAIPTSVISNLENESTTEWMFRTTASTTTNTDLLVCTPTGNVDMTVEQFKAKLASTPLVIIAELVTPTTEIADPYIGIQSCHYDGTEEFVSTGIVPVGHNTKYPDNLRMKLDNLPWNFANLIAPTESAFKATRNYTTGALLIVNNVLYKATANIANGGTITVGTNVTATTLAEVISALS